MPSKTPTRKQKELVKERARWRCEYCQCPAFVSPFTFQVDHIFPFDKGGKTELKNLALSCGCNSFKANRTHARAPKTGKLVLLYHPRSQQWSEHFVCSDNAMQVIGRTPTGRATVAALQMNRYELLNLRELLIGADKHPPHD